MFAAIPLTIAQFADPRILPVRVLSPAIALLLFGLAGCGPSAPIAAPSSIAPPPLPAAGLDRVIGKDAAALQSLFGAPDQDVREAGARKLQFASPVCVLDAYLYPPAAGRPALVTYVDARLPNGDDMDRASCIAALGRRREAR